MRRGTFYLNNNGSRWVRLPKEKIAVVFPDGHEEQRTMLAFESFGNWATVQISIKGKKGFYLPWSDGKIHVEPTPAA